LYRFMDKNVRQLPTNRWRSALPIRQPADTGLNLNVRK
jgi:hypothetical protein